MIDVDGVIVETIGECREGMDTSYKGTWGYHPLRVSFAKTKEALAIVNRHATVHSAEGGAGQLDHTIDLCVRAGFRQVRMRGDCKFSQTDQLDRWDDRGVKFNFGYKCRSNLRELAESVPESAWKRLERPQRKIQTIERTRPVNIKHEVIRRRGIEHLELEYKDLAEFDYRPTACHRGYRMVVVRRNISKSKGDSVLFDAIRYYFSISNDDQSVAPEQIVFNCNRRCDQENLISQLKNGVRSLCASTDNLLSNNDSMLMTSIAWTLKSWAAEIRVKVPSVLSARAWASATCAWTRSGSAANGARSNSTKGVSAAISESGWKSAFSRTPDIRVRISTL